MLFESENVFNTFTACINILEDTKYYTVKIYVNSTKVHHIL